MHFMADSNFNRSARVDVACDRRRTCTARVDDATTADTDQLVGVDPFV